jgi:2-polyprenyl-3-methyl-5-hydroxy-6-metoxy-1,4-benzoquinol methylase
MGNIAHVACRKEFPRFSDVSRTAAIRAIKRLFRPVRNPFLPRQTRHQLSAIRQHEVDAVVHLLDRRGRLLEIGAGTGWQSHALADRGFDVDAIDVRTSTYVEDRVWPVQEYDGHTLPFPRGSFDFVFSSNTLEHIPHLHEFQREILRVLKPDGLAVHVVPSAVWRFWTNLTYPLCYFMPPLAHGEHASNAFAELFAFRRSRWERLFRETGWRPLQYGPSGLFYTGCLVTGRHLSIAARERLSRILGSACHIFVLAKDASHEGSSMQSGPSSFDTGAQRTP